MLRLAISRPVIAKASQQAGRAAAGHQHYPHRQIVLHGADTRRHAAIAG